jgi:hypothetical protein
MSKLRNLRDIGLVLAGVVAGACLSSLPKQASSASQEGDAIAGAIIIDKDKRNRQQHQPDNAEGWEESRDIPVTTVPPTFRRDCFQTTTTVMWRNWMSGSTAAC